MKVIIDKAVCTIAEVLAQHPVCLSYSGGKDSGVLMALAFQAMLRLRAEGRPSQPIHVMHADTEVENPVIAWHNRDEIEKIEAFAAAHQLPVTVHVGRPYTASSWAVRTIGQGKLPVWPGDKQDCTTELKIMPQNRLRAAVMKRIAAASDKPPVIMTGVRFEESAQREAKMRARGDNAEEMIINKDGSLYLAPLAEWTEDDIWNVIQIAGMGKAFENYTSFERTQQIYASATPSSCPVIGDEALGEIKKQRGGCGARFGCWSCCYVGRDKSVENMIENDPDNAFMKHLNMIQRYLVAIRYDYASRSWLPRSINEAGYIRVQPDLLGPTQIENLFKWVVTADIVEQEAASALGIAPRFQIVDVKKLVAIDASWSQLGFHPPFHALKLYRDIAVHGERHFAPEIDAFPRTPRSAARYVHVGSDWEVGASWAPHLMSFGEHRYRAGLDTLASAFTHETGACSVPVTGPMFDVNEESAVWFLDYEAEQAIAEHWDYRARALPDITEGFKTYLRWGIVQVKNAAQCDGILRRTYFRDLLGLTGANPDIQGLLERSISQSEMDEILFRAREARDADRLAEEAAQRAFEDWLTTDNGRAYQRRRELHQVVESARDAMSMRIAGEAYVTAAKHKGVSTVFDGVDYAQVAAKGASRLAALKRKYRRDGETLQAIESATQKIHQPIIAALEAAEDGVVIHNLSGVLTTHSTGLVVGITMGRSCSADITAAVRRLYVPPMPVQEALPLLLPRAASDRAVERRRPDEPLRPALGGSLRPVAGARLSELLRRHATTHPGLGR